jgi:hypothetical protein
MSSKKIGRREAMAIMGLPRDPALPPAGHAAGAASNSELVEEQIRLLR